MPLDALLLLLALVLGLAVPRAQTCAVLAVRQVVERGQWGRFYGFAAMASWAALGVSTASSLWPGSMAITPTASAIPIAVLGGAVFGFGAIFNGACTFGTLSKLAEGKLGFALTLVGLAIGSALMALWDVPLLSEIAAAPPRSRPMQTMVAAGAVLILAAHFALNHRRQPWSLFAALAAIGIAGGLLFALHPAWSYEAVIRDATEQSVLGRMVSGDSLLPALAATAMVGGVISTITNRSFSIILPTPIECFGHVIGGALMALGAFMVPGGNDGMLLRGLPSLIPAVIAAYLTMNLVMALCLALKRTYGLR